MMSDLLSASSLFLAVIGLLYSAWYSEIIKSIKSEISRHRDDRESTIIQVRNTYWSRVLPLAIATTSLSLILLPDFISIIYRVFKIFQSRGLSSVYLYDSVQTLFFAIAIMTFGLAVHVIRLAYKTLSHLHKLKK